MRIILADHHPQVLWALRTTLGEEQGFEVIGEAADAANLMSLAEEHCVDLFLLDTRLPGLPIQDLIPILHTQDPRPIVIAMSSNVEDGRRMLIAGADAFISKADQPGWLVDALRQYARRMQEGCELD